MKNQDEIYIFKVKKKAKMRTQNIDLLKIKCFFLDMDGTFYLGRSLLDGSLDFIRKVIDTGRKFVFLTNNSSRSRKEYIEKLAGFGLNIDLNEIVSSGQATIEYLLNRHPGKTVYLLGNPSLTHEFEEANIRLSDHPDIVVTAFDNSLDYRKLCRVCDLVREGLPFFATHPDFNCPSESGFLPDIGAIHAFIHASAGRMPDVIIGKPNAEIINCALRQAGCAASETAMVGDRLYTDIAAVRFVPGLTGILVLSGETNVPDIVHAEIQPHFVFDSLKDMIAFL